MPTANSCRTRPYNNICHFWFITGQAQVLLVYGFSLHPYKARAGQESNLTASASRCTRTTTAHNVLALVVIHASGAWVTFTRPFLIPIGWNHKFFWAGVLTLLGRHSTVQPDTTKNEATVQTFAPMRQGVQSTNMNQEHLTWRANTTLLRLMPMFGSSVPVARTL